MASDSQTTPHPDDVEAYVVYRSRFEEFYQLFAVWKYLREEADVPPETRKELAATVRMALMVWLHSFFDEVPKTLNVLDLWPRVFPWRADEIAALKMEIAPQLDMLARFRHQTGAHASRRISAHNTARKALSGPEMTEAMNRFFALAEQMAADEGRVPGLCQELDSWGLRKGHDPAWKMPESGER